MLDRFFNKLYEEQKEKQEQERQSLGLSPEAYSRLLEEREAQAKKEQADREQRRKEAEAAEQKRILTEVHEGEQELACTKAQLNRVIKWGSSKFNDYKKHEVVSSIHTTFQQRHTDAAHYWDYTCGSYSEKSTGARTGHYRVISYQGEVRLVVNPLGADKVVYKLVAPRSSV